VKNAFVERLYSKLECTFPLLLTDVLYFDVKTAEVKIINSNYANSNPKYM